LAHLAHQENLVKLVNVAFQVFKVHLEKQAYRVKQEKREQ